MEANNLPVIESLMVGVLVAIIVWLIKSLVGAVSWATRRACLMKQNCAYDPTGIDVMRKYIAQL